MPLGASLTVTAVGNSTCDANGHMLLLQMFPPPVLLTFLPDDLLARQRYTQLDFQGLYDLKEELTKAKKDLDRNTGLGPVALPPGSLDSLSHTPEMSAATPSAKPAVLCWVLAPGPITQGRTQPWTASPQVCQTVIPPCMFTPPIFSANNYESPKGCLPFQHAQVINKNQS